MCFCDQVIQLNKEGMNIKMLLGGLFIIQLFVVLAKIILVQVDCIIGVIGVFLIIVTYLSCHYILAVCTSFVYMGNLLMTIFFILQRVQNSMNKIPDRFLVDNFYMTILVIEAISIVVDAIVISVSFSAYKNYKAAFTQSVYSDLPQDEEKGEEVNKDNNNFSNPLGLLQKKGSFGGFTPLP